MITRTENEAIRLIERRTAVVKTVSVSPTSDRCLDYVLDQLGSPSVKRPVKPLGQVHRHRVFNPKTREWSYRPNEESVRGALKDTPFTKKTSTTLIPADGKMHLFTPKHGDSVGLLFDLEQCHLKDEKYIFAENANTDSKFWLKDKNLDEREQAKRIPQAISLKDLQDQLANDRLKGIIPSWNELNIGLKKDAMVAVFATSHERHARLKALHAKFQIKQKLGIDLPVLIITPKNGVQSYHAEWQQYDLMLTKQYDYVDLPHDFVKSLRLRFKEANPHLLLKTDKQPLERFFAVLNNEDMPPELKLAILKRVDYPTLASLREVMPGRKLIELAMREIKASSLAENERALRSMFQFDTYPDGFANILFTPGNETKMLGRKQELVRVFLTHLFEDKSKHDGLLRLAISKNNRDMLALLIKNNILPDNLESKKDILAGIYRHADVNFLKSLFAMPGFDYDHFSLSAGENIALEGGGTKYIEMIKLDPILSAAIFRDESVLKEVVQQFPEKLVDAISRLKEYSQAHYGFFPREFTIDRRYQMSVPSHFQFSYAKLLLQLSLNVPSHTSYHLSHKEKRVVENYLLGSVAKLSTEEALNAFWDKHKDSLCLNQRQHQIFDSIFRPKNHMTSIKAKLLSEIEKKRGLLRAPQVNALV